MNPLINHHLITQTSLDSGSLTTLGTLVHKFPEPGEYSGTVLLGMDTVGLFRLTVDKECPAMQVNINLATVNSSNFKQYMCNSNQLEKEPRFAVNPKGFVVFHVSHGAGGYAVCVNKFDTNSNIKLFDSRELEEGDLFAVTLIRPGTYSVIDVNNKVKGEIVVSFPKSRNAPYHPPQPVYIEFTGTTFKPDKIEIEAAQGQVYSFKTLSRLKIELIKPDDSPESRNQSKIAKWRKPFNLKQD